MMYVIQSSFMSEFFVNEYCKLKWRRSLFAQDHKDEEPGSDNYNSMQTYGNILFEFCSYRSKLKNFFYKRL